MKWNSVGDFLAMGGAGYFVWMSYGACVVLAIVELWALRRRRRNALRQLDAGAEGSDA